MNKKIVTVCAVLCAVLLCGCAAELPGGAAETPQAGGAAETPQAGGTSVAGAEQATPAEQRYAGTVVDVSATSLLVAGETANDLIRVSAELPCTGAEAFAVGQRVEISYDGMVLETYPAQLSGPTGVTVTGDDDGLLTMYRQAIGELWDGGSGLLTDITVLGCDLSETALTEGVRAGLMWALAEQYGLEPVAGTSEELMEQGYIDREHVVFDDGVLLKLTVTEDGEKKQSFELSLWRAGDGAVGVRCAARLKGGAWTYEVTENWIS